MRVLYCITRSDTIGGAAVHVADMASWLIGLGHDVTVVTGGSGLYAEELQQRGIPQRAAPSLVRPVSPIRDIRAISELRSIFREEKPDVISLHSAKAGLIGRLAAVRIPCPVVLTVHGWPFTEGVSRRKSAIYRWIERVVAPLANIIITVSEYDRQHALKSKVGNANKIRTVHNAMPDVSQRATPSESDGPVRLIMTARLDEPKDHSTVFKALAGIQGRDWELLLIGDGPYEAQLRAEASMLGIADRVKFLGLRRDVAVLLAQCHIFVLASKWEAFPRSILEAMRAGLPVVATDVGGISESVRHGETGYLCDKGDHAALKLRFEELISSPERRARLGAAARLEYEARFRFERMATETLVIYQQLLGHESVS